MEYSTKTKVLVAVIAGVLLFAGAFYFSRPNADESLLTKTLVENFGARLKSVALLSPQAAQDIETQYKDLVTPELVRTWQENPPEAPGRLTSSPWPDRIAVDSVRRLEGGAYLVKGRIIEVTSAPTKETIERGVEISVAKFGDRWLINDVVLGSYNAPTNWKLMIDSGVSFRYPETLEAEYIFPQEWPPEVEVAIAQFFCAEPVRQVNGREYCVGEQDEGAAGSIYTTYVYNTMKNDRMVTVRFTLRYPQCANYATAQRAACEQERRDFDLDGLVDRIVQTVEFR